MNQAMLKLHRLKRVLFIDVFLMSYRITRFNGYGNHLMRILTTRLVVLVTCVKTGGAGDKVRKV